ncbi:MAG: glycosyltransferase family 4 protein [Deltaproteobacteria bacterium]|jgi:glycosyltransferase involved in cell wall biosynthesis|nr:glycosyltransferase family 4 protein [Deltaproteobacteria bacterium]
MKVLMLGWEYPPHIAGGLGVACEGLTKALAQLGVEITFVVPKLMGDENAPHMNLRDACGKKYKRRRQKRIKTFEIPVALAPYLTEESFDDLVGELDLPETRRLLNKNFFPKFTRSELDKFLASLTLAKRAQILLGAGYNAQVYEQVALFADLVFEIAKEEEFDIVHAHDWMTFPAGIAVAQAAGVPLITHVHSLEYDRSGPGINPRIDAIEKAGTGFATAICAVSEHTRQVVQKQHCLPLSKIFTVHNGNLSKKVTKFHKDKAKWTGPVVLFLGRVTLQKGPATFLYAAQKVIAYLPDTIFVMAGTGDLLPSMKQLAKDLGISSNLIFPGFVKGRALEEILSIANLYVMPSISEPFGLSALEAVDFETPALISKQSGVGEVLNHALKFDYWKIQTLADYIINGLLHPEMCQDMIDGAKLELKKLTWQAAAKKVLKIYQHVCGVQHA